MEYKFRDKIESYFQQEKVGGHSITVDEVAAKKTLRFELRQGEVVSGGGCRAEVKLPRVGKNTEWWMGLSCYIESQYKDELMASEDWLTVFQWHDQPDSGEMWRWPITSLQILKGKWVVTSYYDTNALSRGVNGKDTIVKRANYVIGDVEYNKWTDWTMHAKWFWDSKGVLEYWKDRVKHVNIQGAPVCYNDQVGPFFKAGIYTSPEQKKPIVIHLAEITLMDGVGKFGEVDVETRLKVGPPSPLTLEERVRNLELWKETFLA